MRHLQLGAVGVNAAAIPAIRLLWVFWIFALPTASWCGMYPSKLEINLGPFPIDKYFDQNTDGANRLLPNCEQSWTIQNCIKSFFNNNPANPPYNPQNYVGQGVTGVRFFFSLGDGGWYSAPFDSNGNIRSPWLNNLQQFFHDLKSYGIQAVSPTPVLAGGWSGTFIIPVDPPVPSLDPRYTLKFFKWVPFGFIHNPQCQGQPGCNDGFPDGQDLNSAYNGANGNPYFWGWEPFFNLIDSVLAKAQTEAVQVTDLDIEQELNVINFTVLGRLIYDNKHTRNVLGTIRQKMTAHGFDQYRATYSVGMIRPNVPGFDCGSVYGDSAMIMPTSDLAGAIAGAGGKFGLPTSIVWTNGLPCQGQVGTMISLPQGYLQPAIDIHSGICVLDAQGDCNPSVNSYTTARTFYSDVWAFLVWRGLTGRYVVFGETVSNQNCEGYTQQMATWNANGYRDSTLYSNKASTVTLRPWNNEAAGSCYVTPTVINPPYDPRNQ